MIYSSFLALARILCLYRADELEHALLQYFERGLASAIPPSGPLLHLNQAHFATTPTVVFLLSAFGAFI